MPINSSAIFLLIHDELDQEKLISQINKYNGILLRNALIHKDEIELYSSIF